MILENGKFEGKNMTQKELDELGPFVEGAFAEWNRRKSDG